MTKMKTIAKPILVGWVLSISMILITQKAPEKPALQSVLSTHLITVQPIVLCRDDGSDPAPAALPEGLINQAYAPAGIEFCFLEPIQFSHTSARDGRINLDQIVEILRNRRVLKGTGDLIHLIFVAAVDGKTGPLGRGQMNGSITFIALGNQGDEADRYMQAFVVAHEIGHNLGLAHAVDDPRVQVKTPNLMGDGPFSERIGKQSLAPCQVDVICKSPWIRPRIDILSQAEGRAQICDESYDSFFAQMSRMELAAYSGRAVTTTNPGEIAAAAKRTFVEAVMDFSAEERSALVWLTGQVNDLLNFHGLSTMARHPWRFIKCEDWLCSGFSYTRGLCVVLSDRKVQAIAKLWREAQDGGDAGKALQVFGPLLVHEQMHNLQRLYPRRFASRYKDKWGFLQARVASDESVEKRRVGNPDSPWPEWLIPIPGDTQHAYWIRVLFKTDKEIPRLGEDFCEKVFRVQREGDSWQLLHRNGEPDGVPDSAVTAFNSRFPVTVGIDHPNEIAAYLFADYFKFDLLGIQPMRDVGPKQKALRMQFIAWMKEDGAACIQGGVPAMTSPIYQPTWESLDQRPIPAWFQEAKFGIFVHWGVYSVPAWRPLSEKLYGSYAEWYYTRVIGDTQHGGDAFHRANYGEHFEYRDFAPSFRAELFHPDAWADLFQRSGARYVVLTSKHHDGYCLWPTQSPFKKNWNSGSVGPKRDLVGELAQAVRKKGLKMGLYYSIVEWETNPTSRTASHYWLSRNLIDRYGIPLDRYVDEHLLPQLRELVERYRPDLLFADGGEWDEDAEFWQTREFLAWLYNQAPNRSEVVVNDRWCKGMPGRHGDYYSSEYEDAALIQGHPWEESRGVGGSYGFNRAENLDDYRTSEDLIRELIKVVSGGGNFLLNVGPTADGRIPVIQQQRLADIGTWLRINGEGIFGSQRAEGFKPKSHAPVYLTRKGDIYYLFCLQWPGRELAVAIPTGTQAIRRVSLLGSTTTVQWNEKPGEWDIHPGCGDPETLPTSAAYVFRVETGKIE